MVDGERIQGFRSVYAICYQCGHLWIATFQCGTDESTLECSHCESQVSITINLSEKVQ